MSLFWWKRNVDYTSQFYSRATNCFEENDKDKKDHKGLTICRCLSSFSMTFFEPSLAEQLLANNLCYTE